MFFAQKRTPALDLRGQQELLQLIQKIGRERSIAVILCRHLLTEMVHVQDDLVVLNLGQVPAKDSVKEAASKVQKNVTRRNCMRVQVPPAAVLETRQVLNGMPNILRLIRINEVEGWLEMELLPASHSSSVKPYQVNRILGALIRAKIPIISFAPEASLVEDKSLNLATDVSR